MDQQLDPDERGELVRRLFAAMTMALEDVAALAADGQRPQDGAAAQALAQKVRSGAELAVMLAEAAGVIARDGVEFSA